MPASIFSGNFVKALKSNFSLNDTVKFLTGTSDPTSVAQDAPAGSLYHKTDDGAVYRKIDAGSTTNWKKLASGGDSGINYVLNPDFEVNTNGWVTYADAAGDTPVNGTGGSPTLTLTASTSSPLRGNKSGLITKDAANRQGEGISYDFTIDAADKGKRLGISFDYEVSANYVGGEASDLRCFVYDVTNSVLIVPNYIYLDVRSGSYKAVFDASTSTSYRLILHVATTNASAWTVKVDNVVVGPQALVLSAVVQDMVNDSTFLTVNGLGTISGASWSHRRVGNMLEVMGVYQTGTTVASTASLQLPANLAIDFAALTTETDAQLVGHGVREGVSSIAPSSQDYELFLFTDGASTDKIFATSTANIKLLKTNGNSLSNSNEWHSVKFSVPIVGWGNSASVTNASTFRISSVLANGTRVTATPAALGEYRSRSKTTGTSNTFADNAPTTGPSAANGLRLHPVDYATAQTAGDISLYDIFIGKNKHYKIEYYKSASKTGRVATDYSVLSSTDSAGVRDSYDPTTGVLTIDAGINDLTSNTLRSLGRDNGTDGVGAISDGYFDVVVSENALAAITDVAKSQVWLTGGNGAGSSGTKTRRFTTVKSSIGQAIDYVDSATNGASFTIKEAGTYYISYTDLDSGGYTNHGITLNSSNLASNVISLADSEILAYDAGGNGVAAQVSTEAYLSVGDVVRAQFNAADNTASYNVVFKIMKVS